MLVIITLLIINDKINVQKYIYTCLVMLKTIENAADEKEQSWKKQMQHAIIKIDTTGGGTMGKKEAKTNAMRILEKENISFQHYTYECGEFTDGIQVADMLHLPHEKVYKTLVTQGSDHNYYVFVLPIEAELDFKKCAKSVGVKSVEMIHVKDIQKITGYIRGGCTCVGMKKQYVTRSARQAKELPGIIVSGGRLGSQLELMPEDLCMAASAEFAQITLDDNN